MKNKYLSLLLLPLLISCNSYNGIQYELKYDEDASLLEITPYGMFQTGAINKEDSVFLIAGLNGCSSCMKAKEDAEKYINKNHVTIYYIDINHVTFSDNYDGEVDYPKTDYYYMYYSTVYLNEGEEDYYSLPSPEMAKKELSLPAFYFFKYGAVGSKVTNNYLSSLNKFIKVIK